MYSQHITTPAVELHKRGLHFVLCRAADDGARKAKSAIAPRWQHHPAGLEDILQHRAAGGLLGFIPGRSGMLVIDVDKFPGDTKDATGLVERLGVTPLAIVETQRGIHIYLKKSPGDGEIGNRAWALDGFAGDVRADKGYCIAWELGKLGGVLDRLNKADATSVSIFPKPSATPGQPPAVEGNRNNDLNTLIYRLAQEGQKTFYKERDTAIASGLPATEVDTTIHSALEAATRSTFPKKDARALESVFEQLGWKPRYNTRSMSTEFSLDGGTTWKSTNDRTEKKLRRIIAETFRYRSFKEGKRIVRELRYGRDLWEEHLGAILADHEVDPFKLWLEGLAIWDGKKRLHRVLNDTFQADESPLTCWASTYLCLGPVQRALEPGCKLDEIPILIGSQGLGKSALIRNLLPPDQPGWFSDSLSMTDTLQKRVESLQGRVIVELSDLQGFRKADLESMKAFITRVDDGSVRLSYRRNPETMQRRCILIGTADKSECLPNDSAGNRRYVPIRCHGGSNVESFMDAHRSQLWSEALSIYREGRGRANLPRNLMGLQSDQAETHRRKDQVIEDSVSSLIGYGPDTMAELCHKTNTDARDVRAVNRLADALRLAGWRKNRERLENGNRAYLWTQE